MNILFSQMMLKHRTVQNRFIAQPMEGNDAIDGKVSERTIERYKELARGNWGIIIIEALSITDASLARKNQMVIKREHLDGFKKLVSEMKKIDPNVTILFQITHSGRKAGKAFSQPAVMYNPSQDDHLLTTDEILDIKKKFVEGVLLTEEAGADGVDFKLCHGYLGCEMLRPANIRDDAYGGSFENRTRFLRESVQEIKEKLQNKNFILGSRISYYEGIIGGCGTAAPDDAVEDLEEMDKIISLMNSLQFDYVNVSAGIPGVTSEITRPTHTSRWFYLHQFRYARRARKFAGNMKVFGSAYSILKEDALEAAKKNIQRGDIDGAGWGRQILADPLFPKKILKEEKVDYCISCSGCSKLMIKQEQIECIMYNRK